MRGRNDANGSTFDKRAEGVEGADSRPDIGAAGDHGLLGFACPLSVEDVERNAMPLKKSGILAELGKRIFPRAGKTGGNTQRLLREHRRIEGGRDEQRNPSSAEEFWSGHSHFPPHKAAPVRRAMWRRARSYWKCRLRAIHADRTKYPPGRWVLIRRRSVVPA